MAKRGRPTKEASLIKQVNQQVTPIARAEGDNLILPNHSGITDHPEYKNDNTFLAIDGSNANQLVNINGFGFNCGGLFVDNITVNGDTIVSDTGQVDFGDDNLVTTGTITGTIATASQPNIDHGSLSGLSDDDHTQYFLADGTRAISGDIDFSGSSPTIEGNHAEGSLSVCSQNTTVGPKIVLYGAAHATQSNQIEYITSGTVRLNWTDKWDFKSEDITTTGDITATNIAGTITTATQGTIDHDSLANFSANEHIDWTSTTSSLVTTGDITGATGRYDDMGIGTAVDATTLLRLDKSDTSTSGTMRGIYLTTDFNPTSSSTTSHRGMQIGVLKEGAQNSTVAVIGCLFQVTQNGTGTVNNLLGISGTANILNTGNVTNAFGAEFVASNSNATSTLTNSYGVRIKTPTATGTITNAYGLYIQDITTGSSNHAILTEGGDVVFNEQGFDSNFRVESDASPNCFLIDGGNNNISINGASISANYDLLLRGDGVLAMAETTTPTADTNYGKVYCKSDNKLYFQDGAGTEHEIAFV